MHQVLCCSPRRDKNKTNSQKDLVSVTVEVCVRLQPSIGSGRKKYPAFMGV